MQLKSRIILGLLRNTHLLFRAVPPQYQRREPDFLFIAFLGMFMLGGRTVCGMMEFSFSFTVPLLLPITVMSTGPLIE